MNRTSVVLIRTLEVNPRFLKGLCSLNSFHSESKEGVNSSLTVMIVKLNREDLVDLICFDFHSKFWFQLEICDAEVLTVNTL